MTGRVLCVGLFLCCQFYADWSWSHGEIIPRIQKATTEIAKDPTNASLYRNRGALHSKYGNWTAALSDFQEAGRLQGGFAGLERQLAETLLMLERYDEAGKTLAPYLQAHATDLQAQRLHARLLAAEGRLDEADSVYGRMIAAIPRPTTDLYAEWIDAIAANGSEHYPRALERIQVALGQLGPVPSLQLKAMRLEEERGDFAAALGWLDILLNHSAHPEIWLVKKAHLLKQSGRNEEAVDACQKALSAWKQRPAWSRETAEAKKLHQQILRELP